ncbi:uncharacterized protein RJT20DRAFT_135841 [Scheffersomyces xylosifermentans]|uniref:uncharacterized protein n=1 Tax=Scheffersomyces xylosifermentans TaxID=1304137 RepID=UPI00315D9CD3
MSEKNFKQVDVFTDVKFKGNPVIVFFDADNLSTEQMQDIARWTNLSETTFVEKTTQSGADYKVRIFCPTYEMPFAGHPTIGTCYALLESGRITPTNGKLVQECNAGLVEITVDNYDPKDISRVYLSFKLPYYKFEELPENLYPEVEESLGLQQNTIASLPKPVIVDDGPVWAVVQLKDGQSVLDLQLDFSKISLLSEKYSWDGIGVFGKHDNGLYEARNFAPFTGTPEDPACGSGAGAVGAYLGAYLQEKVSSFRINQGLKVGRDAKIEVSLTSDEDDLRVHVGGRAVTCLNGSY